MKKMMLMMVAGFMAGALFSAHAYVAKNFNARSVSVQFRFTKWFYDGSQGACCECSEDQAYDGSIRVFTIQNGQVNFVDTIYTREQGLAQYPVFDLTGRRIAFFRKDIGPQGPNGAGSCVTKNDGKSHISIINFDGAGLRDLCDLPGRPGFDEGLDWPGGEWIYYVCPKSAADALAAGGAGNSNSVAIWKVNATTGTNQVVCDLNSAGTAKCYYWRRFSVDITGDRMSGQSMGYNGCSGGSFPGGNGVWDFPPSNCALHTVCGVAACNAAISPSGTIVGHYMGGNHIEMWMTDVNTCKPLNPGTTANPYGCVYLKKDANGGDNLETWAAESLGNGCEHIKWSRNSDKWVMQDVGWWGHAERIAWGANQVVMNWKDKVALNITKTPKGPVQPTDVQGLMEPAGIAISNSTGDLWIDDPVNNPLKNKYEDLQGVWHEVPGATTAASPIFSAGMNTAPAAMNGSRIRVQVSGNGPWAIAISSADGRTMRLQRGAGPEARIATAGLCVGVYMMKISNRSGSVIRRLMMR